MQRVKRKEIKYFSNLAKSPQNYINSYNNIIPNGNKNKIIERNSLVNKDLKINRSNKFLSIPERQKIIHEINNSKNQLNLYHPLEPKETLDAKKNEENKNVLYVKKTKSNMNLNENKNKEGNTNNKNNEYNHIKFTENKDLINKTIKEYYNKKIENPFKTYLKSLNNDFKEHAKSNQIKNRNIYQNPKNIENNLNIGSSEIYKKPISNQIYNKQNPKNINKNNDINKNNKKNSQNTDLKKLYITNSTRNEKINCTKMINNNGVKKNIFNIINNYNTKTIKNNSNLKYSSIKKNDIKLKQNNTKEFLTKNNSSNNFMLKYNNTNTNIKSLNETYFKDYLLKKGNTLQNNTTSEFNLKNKSCKNNKSLKLIKSSYLNEEINKVVITNNDYYLLNNEENKNKKMFYSNSNNNLNLKYVKKNIASPSGCTLPKKRMFKSNFISNDLPRILVEKDLISFANQNNGKINKNYNDIYFKNEGNNENDNNINNFNSIDNNNNLKKNKVNPYIKSVSLISNYSERYMSLKEKVKPIIGTNYIQFFEPATNRITKIQIPLTKEKNGYIVFPEGCRHILIDSELFITGGSDNCGNPINIVLMLNIENGEMTRLGNLNDNHSYHSLEYLENFDCIILIGGENSNSVEIMDLDSRKWTKLPSLNYARANINIYYNNLTSDLFALFGMEGKMNDKAQNTDAIEVLELNDIIGGWMKVDYYKSVGFDMKNNYCITLPFTREKLIVYGGSTARSIEKRIFALFDMIKNEVIKVDSQTMDLIKLEENKIRSFDTALQKIM